MRYDPAPYYNDDDAIWQEVKQQPQHPIQNHCTALGLCRGELPIRAIYITHQYINSCGCDITSGCNRWLSIGSFIFQTLGDNGLEVFKDISLFHSDYNPVECERIFFNSCAKYSKTIGLGVFLKACADAGLPNLKELMKE